MHYLYKTWKAIDYFTIKEKFGKKGGAKMTKPIVNKEKGADCKPKTDAAYPVFEGSASSSDHRRPWSCGMTVNMHMKGVLPAELITLVNQDYRY